jgi:hypothetical protein
MDAMQQKIRMILTHIEQSSIAESEKKNLVKILFDDIHDTISPILSVYMPSDKLAEFSEHPESITTDAFAAMYMNAITNKECHDEVKTALEEILEVYEKLLRDKMIIV